MTSQRYFKENPSIKINKKYGMLTVLEATSERISNREIVWKCLCQCGKETKMSTGNLKNKKNPRSCGCALKAKYRYKKCISCGKTKSRIKFNMHNSRRQLRCRSCQVIFNKERKIYWDKKKTISHISNYLIQSAKYRSKQKGWEFDLNIDWMRQRLEKGTCEVTGIIFQKRSNMWAASIDRINNSIGYLKSNCRLVVRCYNQMKGCGTDEDVIYLAKIIMNTIGRKKHAS